MALRDVGRVLGLSYGHVDRICKMASFDPPGHSHFKSQLIETRYTEEIKNNMAKKL